jgi:DNA primase
MIRGNRNRWWQQISLLGYLQQQGWKPVGRRGREEVAGLCPLHSETRPSFYVNRRKQVFYCHGCGRGGDLVRLVELREGLSFAGALERLAPAAAGGDPLEETYRFYQAQLSYYPEARQYLAERGLWDAEILARLRTGYAPGACLRAHLEGLGYPRTQLQSAGLMDERGRDRFFGCLTFPLEEAGNLYGRALGEGQPRHRFLPRPKGGLYGWKQARSYASLIVVEGLLDLAALWQAGFPQVVAVLGVWLNEQQMGQIGDSLARTVYVCLDSDAAGARAAERLVKQLRAAGWDARRVSLPWGHDPNSYLAGGGTAADFQHCLNQARP